MLPPTIAGAKEVRVPSRRPVISIDMRDGWSVEDTDRGIEARSPDEEVFLWFEVYAPASEKKVFDEHQRYFNEQGVRIVGESKSSTSSENGVTIKATAFPATWKGKPTILRYLSYDLDLASRQLILMSYWASPEGDRKHDPAMQNIIGSFKALAK